MIKLADVPELEVYIQNCQYPNGQGYIFDAYPYANDNNVNFYHRYIIG